MDVDYLIVGSGLTGAVIARILTDAGRKVLVLEKRRHVGGNVHDQRHESGIPYHIYGPHFFRTSSDQVWQFVRRFSSFHPFEAVIKTCVDGRLENWPIAAEYIERAVGADWEPPFKGVPRNFEERCLSIMPQLVYEKFVKSYTEKQWGISANTLSPELAHRFDVRLDNDPRLVQSPYQGLPVNGYSHLMRNMLSGIDVRLNCDFLRHRGEIQARKRLIFTGPIDAFFDYRLGRLQYRGQRRKLEYLPRVSRHQPSHIVNYPSRDSEHIRTIEWKNLMQPPEAGNCAGTLLSHETPFSPDDDDAFEYPFPDRTNRSLYEDYLHLAEASPGLVVCGRLGEYRYYDMDQAIERAMLVAQRILYRRSF